MAFKIKHIDANVKHIDQQVVDTVDMLLAFPKTYHNTDSILKSTCVDAAAGLSKASNKLARHALLVDAQLYAKSKGSENLLVTFDAQVINIQVKINTCRSLLKSCIDIARS